MDLIQASNNKLTHYKIKTFVLSETSSGTNDRSAGGALIFAPVKTFFDAIPAEMVTAFGSHMWIW